MSAEEGSAEQCRRTSGVQNNVEERTSSVLEELFDLMRIVVKRVLVSYDAQA